MCEKTQYDLLEEIRDYVNEMSNLQGCFISYIDGDLNDASKYQNLIQSVNDHKILGDKHKMREFLQLISEVSSYHHHSTQFFTKIEKILKKIQNEIKKFVSNEGIFNIFSTNNRILLFLFREKIITPDINLLTRLFNADNSEELKKCFKIHNDPKLTREKNDEISINEAVIDTEIQKYGESDDKICKIIQNDSLDEFISLKVNINLTFEPSTYETNLFLKDKTPSIIEYSAFYGSINIFKYACSNNAELTSSLWLYAIHGRNPEIIHELDNHNVDPPYRSFEDPAIELIKCHHNELAEDIINTRLNDELTNYEDQNLCYLHLYLRAFESYNYEMIGNRFDIDFDSNKPEIFPEIFKNDYFYIFEKILAIEDIDINAQTI